jgi:hypothetical protein
MFACIADESAEEDYVRVANELKRGRLNRQKLHLLTAQMNRLKADQQAERRWFENELKVVKPSTHATTHI